VQRAYRLLVLLLLVDVEEVVKPLQELHRAALGADAVLICAWSNEVSIMIAVVYLAGRLGHCPCILLNELLLVLQFL
jgi:hypothetical protein